MEQREFFIFIVKKTENPKSLSSKNVKNNDKKAFFAEKRIIMTQYYNNNNKIFIKLMANVKKIIHLANREKGNALCDQIKTRLSLFIIIFLNV